MEIRFPATTPRVSRSKMLGPRDVVLIDGAQFDDAQLAADTTGEQ